MLSLISYFPKFHRDSVNIHSNKRVLAVIKSKEAMEFLKAPTLHPNREQTKLPRTLQFYNQ